MPLPFHTLAVAVAVAILFLTATSDPDDEHCLTHFHQSLQDPFQNLQNWTKSAFSDPCNGFTSILTGITCNNGRIFKLILPNLSLSGTISPYLSNCTNLQTLDLSSNSFSGQIPTDLQSLVNLAVLNLSHNRLSGNIPNELARCAYLNVIDFHDNRLSGGIPQQLGMLVRLTAFDVSKNRLSGSIPGSLGRFNVSSYEGNKELYGYPLGEMKNRGLSIVAIVGIGLGSGVVSLVVSFTAVCIWLRVSEKKMEMMGGSSKGGGGGDQHMMPHY